MARGTHVRRLLGPSARSSAAPPRAAGADSSWSAPLSQRELQVLRLLDTALTGPEIARELFVSHNTLRSHTKHIFTKLGVNSRPAAVSRAKEQRSALARFRRRDSHSPITSWGDAGSPHPFLGSGHSAAPAADTRTGRSRHVHHHHHAHPRVPACPPSSLDCCSSSSSSSTPTRTSRRHHHRLDRRRAPHHGDVGPAAGRDHRDVPPSGDGDRTPGSGRISAVRLQLSSPSLSPSSRCSCCLAGRPGAPVRRRLPRHLHRRRRRRRRRVAAAASLVAAVGYLVGGSLFGIVLYRAGSSRAGPPRCSPSAPSPPS